MVGMKKQRRRVLVGVAVVMGLGVGVKYGRWYVLPRRFAEVEAGRFYRGGYTEPWPYSRVIEKYGLKTVVSLNCLPPSDPRHGAEQAVIDEYGLGYHCFPMPGDGRGDFDRLEAAAAVLNDASTHPVFVHCSAGVHRTNATYAAYRMLYCGWTYAEAMAECEQYGLHPRRHKALFDHLRRFYEERVAGRSADG
jgi:protein tyrosine phosphatase (PTP) superfamily phosphohydrolase (DUF442 family)